jgi:uncharacterized protein (TIGR02391 family)
MRGECDIAVLQAMKAVEVTVRNATPSLDKKLLGVKLMRAAFSPENGALTDFDADAGESVARMELFAGAIGSYKNAHSHPDVNLDDPTEALETIRFANHLLANCRCSCRSHNRGATMNDLILFTGNTFPTLIDAAGNPARMRFLEFFTANIRNPNATFLREGSGGISAWCAFAGVPSIAAVQPASSHRPARLRTVTSLGIEPRLRMKNSFGRREPDRISVIQRRKARAARRSAGPADLTTRARMPSARMLATSLV